MMRKDCPSCQKLDLLLSLEDLVDAFHQMVIDMLNLPKYHSPMYMLFIEAYDTPLVGK